MTGRSYIFFPASLGAGLRGLLLAVFVAVSLFHGPTMLAQLPLGSSPNGSPATAQGSSASTRDDAGQTGSGGSDVGFNSDAGWNGDGEGLSRGGGGIAAGRVTALSADRILTILQEQPDAVVELKSLMADVSQQQGVPLQADSISDEMLYSRVASSADLRASITTFLRARGYVNNSGLESDAAGETDGESNIDNAEVSSQQGSYQNEQISSARDLAAARTRDGNPIDGVSGLDTAAQSGGPRGPATALRRRDSRSEHSADDSARKLANEQRVLHRPTPYNLLSLRDLYTQSPEEPGQLKRFGSDVFLRRNAFSMNRIGEMPLDVPAGPDYVVGPGDSLAINLWGGVSQSLTRVVDREGRVALPDSGTVQVAGLTLERVQGVVLEQLRPQYRDLQVAVTVSHLRSIRVFVVGDVQRPGAYDISSLSSSLNALYAAGGPTGVGSLRVLRHYRGKVLIGEIDLYDFLLHGVQIEDRLQAGDTLLVPPAGAQIAVYGAVKRPAIYELKASANKDPASLADVLQDAGGATVAADLEHVVVERIESGQGTSHQRVTVSLDLPGNAAGAQASIAEFAVQDGDRVHVAPILPYSQRLVYVEGHVARPGRMPFHEGMKLNDLLRSYQDLLPEPADKGEIVRLVAPDLHPETIEFNVPDALIGNNNIALQPYDTIRIHGRYEADAPRVSIGGEVLRPGTYSLPTGMTAAQLVRMAGGFKRDALLDNADLISYSISGGTKVISERTSVRIGDAVLSNRSDADVPLKPGDVLTVHQIAGWNDIGSTITIEGEVAHPGNYGIQQGERLSSILERAGGFRETSYPSGAVLLREEVRKLEQKSRDELIRQIETTSSAARVGQDLGSTDQTAKLQLIAQQQEQVLERLKSQPASGRLVIQIGTDIASWKGTAADIEVRAGDVLRVPKRPGFVLVSGQVYNASAITYEPNRTASWYLRHAGGATEVADTKDIFVIRANGSVVGRGRGGMWPGNEVLGTRLNPGDVVVVPQRIIGASLFWRNLLTVAQVSSSIAITASVAGVL